MKWIACEVANETEIEGIAFHTMCPVFKGEPKLNTFYHPFEYLEKRKNNISNVGLYIFGGKLKNNETLNTLSIIRFGSKPVKWQILETEGVKPNPRYYHSMCHYPELNILMIYGGKSNNPIKDEMYGEIFQDIWVLNLSNLNWIKALTNKINEIGRCGHSTVLHGNK